MLSDLEVCLCMVSRMRRFGRRFGAPEEEAPPRIARLRTLLL